MEPYDLKLAAAAERMLARLPEFAAAAIVEFVTGPLLANPLRIGKPLGLELIGYHVARRGAYRVVYRVEEAIHVVRVVRIDHRSDVYRTH
jgi:mRNA-degrading endonuclease RelE of RelBE toxin-antitoxin system